jgi:hypothetical protein
MTHDVFICHSSQDRTIAQAVCSKLEEHRIRCWIAPRDVVPGSEYAQSIVEAIAGTKLTVLVFSENSNLSPHVHRELERTASHGIPILPFRVQDVVPSPAVEYFISDAHWLDAVTPPMEKHLEYLVGTVRLLLDREAAKVAGTPLPEAPTPVAPVGRPSAKKWLWAAAAAVGVVVAIVVGLLLARPGSDGGAGTASGGSTDSPTVTGTSQAVEPFVDELEGTLGPGWAWEDEDPDAWSTGADGLKVRVQQAPPFRNVLLREQPSASYTVRVHLQFDPRAPDQFAGLVITGEDLDDRLQFGWSSAGLSFTLLEDRAITAGAEVARDQFRNREWVESDLEVQVENGFYTVRYVPEVDPPWEVESGELPDGLDRIGLIAFSSGGAATDTATFDRFVVE